MRRLCEVNLIREAGPGYSWNWEAKNWSWQLELHYQLMKERL